MITTRRRFLASSGAVLGASLLPAGNPRPGETSLNAEIEEGQKAAMPCHLDNISSRMGDSLLVDTLDSIAVRNPRAADLWGRAYRPGWVPQV